MDRLHTRDRLTCSRSDYWTGVFDPDCVRALYLGELGFRRCEVISTMASSGLVPARTLVLSPPASAVELIPGVGTIAWKEGGTLVDGTYSFSVEPRNLKAHIFGNAYCVGNSVVHEMVVRVDAVFLGGTIERIIREQFMERIPRSVAFIGQWSNRKRKTNVDA